MTLTSRISRQPKPFPHQPTMNASELYDAISNLISDNIGDDVSTFELVGVLEMIKAEFQAAAMAGDDADEEEVIAE